MTEPTKTISMPKFDFSASRVTEEQLKQDLASQSSGGKFFRPGKYDVEIAEVEVRGMSKTDPTWVNLAVTLKAGEKEIRSNVQVPTRSHGYTSKAGKVTYFPFKKLQTFVEALGGRIGAETMQQDLQSVFSNPQNLVGLNVNIEVGYRKGYVNYHGKTSDDKPAYCLVLQDGNKVTDAAKNVILFADHQAAYAYAESNKIAVDKFAEVLAYAPSASGKKLSTQQDPW